jgi:16S rRNA processing protein RimM
LSSEFYLVGRVRRAHGLRGELVVESLTDAPDAIFAAGRRVFAGSTDGEPAQPPRELRVLRSSPFKGGLIVAFEGIDGRDEADRWRNRYLLVPDSEVTPPSADEVFIHELVGMHVTRVTGEDIGDVVEVFELPQGLVMEVARAGATPVLLPFDDRTVTEVDSARRVIMVDPIEGLLD